MAQLNGPKLWTNNLDDLRQLVRDSQLELAAPVRFKRRYLAWTIGACFSVFLLIGLSGLITEQAGSGSFLFAAGLTVASVVLVIRSFRMATIIIRDDTLVIRGFLRSRRIPIDKIRTVEPIDERNMYGMAGKTLAFLTVDGGRVVAGEFWSRVDRSGNAPRIDAVARELSKVRKARAANPGAGAID